jgi:Protein of unknown function (DUF3485)
VQTVPARSPSGHEDTLLTIEVPITIMTSLSLRPLTSAPKDAIQRSAEARAVVSPWVWMTVTCLLLGLSGGIRYWRESKFSALAVESAASPFPLAELPKTMGRWQATDGPEAQLDPEVMRYAGASEHIARTYVDQKTGEQASVLALYGLGTIVYTHIPDICYPTAGYQLLRGPIDGSIAVPGVEGPVRYRWAVYTKRVGSLYRYEEVYHTFLHHKDWVPDASDRWKMFRYYPGLYKIQIARAISSLPENDEGPCRELLTEFVSQVNERLASAGSAGGASAAAATAPAGR